MAPARTDLTRPGRRIAVTGRGRAREAGAMAKIEQGNAKASREPRTPDAELIRRCVAGNAPAWEELIVRYRRLIYSIPVQYGFAPDLADEVFQQVAVKLFENLAKLRNAEGLASWLATTTRRECWRLTGRGQQAEATEPEQFERMEADAPDLDERLDAVQREHAMARALEVLGGTCQELLTALYVEDPTPSYEELSRRLGRPVGSLGPTRSRCLKKLEKIYRKFMPDDEMT